MQTPVLAALLALAPLSTFSHCDGGGDDPVTYACTPTQFHNNSCSVLGMATPWTLHFDGTTAEAVGMFTCRGTTTGDVFQCHFFGGQNTEDDRCIFQMTRAADGSLDTVILASGTSCHCTPEP